jgi:hypothetical protein
MQKAQDLQKKMEALKEETKKLEFSSTSGGGLVKIIMNGDGQIKSIELDDSIIKVEEKTLINDLIIAAYNDCRAKINQYNDDKAKDLTAGLPLPPGFKLPNF